MNGTPYCSHRKKPSDGGFRSLRTRLHRSTYWRTPQAAAAGAQREVGGSDIFELAQNSPCKLSRSPQLSAAKQIDGVVDMSRQPNEVRRHIMGELVVAAAVSLCSTLSWTEEGNRIRDDLAKPLRTARAHMVAGSRGYWIIWWRHVRTGHPGMTGGLSIRYLKPTPLNKTIHAGCRSLMTVVPKSVPPCGATR